MTRFIVRGNQRMKHVLSTFGRQPRGKTRKVSIYWEINVALSYMSFCKLVSNTTQQHRLSSTRLANDGKLAHAQEFIERHLDRLILTLAQRVNNSLQRGGEETLFVERGDHFFRTRSINCRMKTLNTYVLK